MQHNCRAKIIPALLTALLLTLLSVDAQNSFERDAEGWTVFTPHAETKIIYVSSSGGNDETGVAYGVGAAAVGSDPFLPAGAVNAFKTVEGAMAAARQGQPDLVLFKRGDVWLGQSLSFWSGLSDEAPFLMSAYGEGERPLFKTGKENGISYCCKSFNNFAVAHLDFYAQERNPASEEFTGTDGDGKGLSIFVGDEFLGRGVLVEGCRFRFFINNTVQAWGELQDVVIRRTAFLDNYNPDAHSQGLYSASVPLTVEECIFDHNGWYNKAGAAGTDYGHATIFNHNTYFANSHDVVMRENIFLRASSIGTKWTANDGESSARNIVIDNNLYVEGELGISMGGNDTEPSYRFKDIAVTNNVMLDIGRDQPTDRTLGWYLEINDWDQGIVAGNYFLHVTNPEVTNVYGIDLNGETRNLDIRQNVIYGLNTPGQLVKLSDGSVKENITLTDNILHNTNDRGEMIVAESSLENYTFSGNQYYGTMDKNEWFKIGESAYNLQDWQSESGEADAIAGEADFPDPSRGIESYMETLGMEASFEAFIAKLRVQRKGSWDIRFTAPQVNNWIRAGFGAEPLVIKDPSIQRGTEQMGVEITPRHYKVYSLKGVYLGQVTDRKFQRGGMPEGVLLLPAFDGSGGNHSLPWAFK